MLRPYQQRAIDQLYAWLAQNDGNPCLVLPTGSGKSHIVAALCKDAVQSWPETRILMLTHQKELIEQNAEKMRLHWPGAPLGIYSASVGKRQLGEPITFAGIQSVRTRAKDIGHIDLVVIDECHAVSHKNTGSYRTLIDDLTAINPRLRVVGLSATPYRLGHGMITDKPAIFDGLIEPASIEELVFKGYLAKLQSKLTKTRLSTDGVHKRGGEYIESELQAAVNTPLNNAGVVDEVIRLAGDRRAWLFFCTGVAHSHAIKQALLDRGIVAECVTGDTPKAERERILSEFKAGNIRALTNANVLTTGFDYPDIDLIAMLRPTLSPGLYVQMAGRGMRIKSHTDHCLVLDFAGVVETHGPITAVRPPPKPGEGQGDAPIKSCPECHEIVHAAVQTCPACGFQFPPPSPKKMTLHDVDIMGIERQEMRVQSWQWEKYTSYTSGKEMLRVRYYSDDIAAQPVKEYLTVKHEGYAQQRALRELARIAHQAQVEQGGMQGDDLDEIASALNKATPPCRITYKRDGKLDRIFEREWQ